jgi:hypothetical protein
MSSKTSPLRIYYMSAIVVVVAIIAALLIALYSPSISVTEAQSILQTLISLDGVLFGFSAVMIGLVFGSQKRISKKLVRNSALLILVSFWCYLVSLGISFDFIYYEAQKAVFAPIYLTLIGAACSSIYMVLLFVEEQESTLGK